MMVMVSAIVRPIIRPVRCEGESEEDFKLEAPFGEEDWARAVGETAEPSEFVPNTLGREEAPLISQVNSVCITKIVRDDLLGQT